MSAPSRAAFVQVAASACLWGTWSLYVRPSGISPLASAPLVFGVIAILTFALFRYDAVTPRYDRTVIGLLLLNGLCDAVNLVTFFGAMQCTTVAVAVLTHYLCPVLVSLAAPYIDGERVRGATVAALVSTGGLALVLEPWDPAHRTGDVLLGGLLGATSAFAYAANVFLVRRLGARIGAARTQGWHAWIAALLVFPLAWGELGAVVANPRGALLLAGGAVMCGVLPGWMFTVGIRTVGPSRAAVLTFLEPFVAVLVGWLVFGEPVSVFTWLGGAVIVGSGLWVTRAAR